MIGTWLPHPGRRENILEGDFSGEFYLIPKGVTIMMAASAAT